MGKSINENVTDKYLFDYILSTIYNVSFFDYEIYYTSEERKIIRDELYKFKDSIIKRIEDLELFVQSSTKADIKKVLKKVPYNIKNF